MESPEKEAGLSETLIEQGEYGRLDDWNHDSSKSNFNFSFQVIGSKWNKILQTLETFFECESCGVTVCEEVYYGVIQFICCVYILPVVPEQLHHAGFNSKEVAGATSLITGIASILMGLLTNLPFCCAPPTSVSIFYAVYVQQHNISFNCATTSIIYSGLGLMLFYYGPFLRFFRNCIPNSIQAAAAVGIGIFTALAGADEVNMVIQGEYTILDRGNLNNEHFMTLAGVIIITVCSIYHIKGSFCIGLVTISLIWWAHNDSWPSGVVEAPSLKYFDLDHTFGQYEFRLIFTLILLYAVFLNGLVMSLGDLGGFIRPDNTVKNEPELYLIAGAATIFSGMLGGAPILISPESGGGIKAGARTGLSSVICGLMFVLSVFFGPLFTAIPLAATSPLLIMIGVYLFVNVKKIDWTNMRIAVPAFMTLFLIPFTYSIPYGVLTGYVFYIIIGVLSKQLLDEWKQTAKLLKLKSEMQKKKGETETVDTLRALLDQATDEDINKSQFMQWVLDYIDTVDMCASIASRHPSTVVDKSSMASAGDFDRGSRRYDSLRHTTTGMRNTIVIRPSMTTSYTRHRSMESDQNRTNSTAPGESNSFDPLRVLEADPRARNFIAYGILNDGVRDSMTGMHDMQT